MYAYKLHILNYIHADLKGGGDPTAIKPALQTSLGTVGSWISLCLDVCKSLKDA